MIDKDKIVKEAYDYASKGKFQLQAQYDGFVPENDAIAYEEKAWYLVKAVTIDQLDMAYTMILMNGLPEDEITPEELLRYIASDADTDYDTLSIESVMLFDLT